MELYQHKADIYIIFFSSYNVSALWCHQDITKSKALALLQFKQITVPCIELFDFVIGP